MKTPKKTRSKITNSKLKTQDGKATQGGMTIQGSMTTQGVMAAQGGMTPQRGMATTGHCHTRGHIATQGGPRNWEPEQVLVKKLDFLNRLYPFDDGK